ncbi:MAG: DUF4065 domain-containing protein [Clostridia bacterium]
MITHCILLSSSYFQGIRIAIDYCIEDMNAEEYLINRIKDIMNQCGKDVSISTHYIQTKSKEWKSVYEKDSFFKEVKLIDTTEEFIKLIKQDRTFLGIDVAKYILSKVKCTHLKLEKLVYLCYADYLCNTQEKLFEDNIYAFRYGPVIDSVYERYKIYGCDTIEEKECEDDKYIDSLDILEMPSKSRLLFAISGVDKCNSIDKTLAKYGHYTAGKLIDITHKKNSPWELTYTGEEYKLILDETISKYHKFENI